MLLHFLGREGASRFQSGGLIPWLSLRQKLMTIASGHKAPVLKGRISLIVRVMLCDCFLSADEGRDFNRLLCRFPDLWLGFLAGNQRIRKLRP
jgi:hypothetical protein